MNKALVRQAAEFFGISVARIFDEQKGYRNKSFHILTPKQENLNLIFYKSEPNILARIRRADTLSETAHASGLPVRHLYDPRILELKGARKTTYARLYYYLPGTTIAWEMFSMNHIKVLGLAMSDLHHALKDAPANLPLATDEMLLLDERMEKYFHDPNVTSALKEKLNLSINPLIFNKLKKTLEQAAQLPPQPLHLDLVRGNLLFSNSDKITPSGISESGSLREKRVRPVATGADDAVRLELSCLSCWRVGSVHLSGIIDFEKAALGHPTLDLARSFAFLLVDVPSKPPKKIFKYLIESGYNKRGQSQIDLDPKLFESLANFFLIHDFYKFLRHNPYESLASNHHYLKTRDILLASNMLQYNC